MSSISLPKRAAIFAACVGATAAVGATPALASSPGVNIYGSGSSLQKIVQQNLWDPNWSSTTADHPQLSNSPTATYTSSSSGQGLAEFGNTTGTLDPTQDTGAPSGTLDAYIGTDDPPTPNDLADAQTASGGAQEVTIPVAQAPVAVLLSLPVGITLGAGTKIDLTNGSGSSPKLLQNIWSNAVSAAAPYGANEWGSLLLRAGLKKYTGTGTIPVNEFKDTGAPGSPGTGGYEPITRQVRSSSSGTSYSFKGFLYLSDTAGYTNTYVVDDDTWPVAVSDISPKGSDEVTNTTANPGSIGYANLADAAAGSNGTYVGAPTTVSAGGSHQIEFAEIQDNQGGSTAEYAGPQTSTGVPNVYKGSNIKINGSPAGGVGQWVEPSSATGSWGSDTPGDGTLASDPDVYGHASNVKDYPIVASTYDVGWTSYTQGKLGPMYPLGSGKTGVTVNSLLTYIVGTGQTDVTNADDDYAALPSAIDTKSKQFVSSVG